LDIASAQESLGEHINEAALRSAQDVVGGKPDIQGGNISEKPKGVKSFVGEFVGRCPHDLETLRPHVSLN
jgi:hypothetical protein